MNTPRLILASQSARRRELMTLLGLPFDTLACDIDETPHPDEPPIDYVRRLSIEKAQTAASRIEGDALIIACDTTVADGAAILGKPADADEARAMLQQLRARTHVVYTAMTLINTAAGKAIMQVATSPVVMRDYTDAEMDAYIASGDPFDKAGAYAIQNRTFHPVEEFSHCRANVMGLPLCHVTRMLREMGIAPKSDVPVACQQHIEYECPVFKHVLAGRD